MRMIGHLRGDAQARRFEAYLHGQGIEAQFEADDQDRWEVWVLDEEQLEPAKLLLERFMRDPDDPAFQQVAGAGADDKDREAKETVPRRARVINARTTFQQAAGLGSLTLVLILVSFVVAAVTRLDNNNPLGRLLSISEPLSRAVHLPEVREGQVWRLFTPMFLHFGIMHLLFNMLWLRDLGSMIEARKGMRTLLALVLVTSAVSNLGQYVASGPTFGGMSGVVYALLGYVWMQGRFNPSAGLALRTETVIMMIVWFFMGLSGVIPHVANTAHGVGLAAGMAWGYLAAHVRRH